MTHIFVSNLTIFDSDNGLLHGRSEAIIWSNSGILLIGPSGTIFSEILITIHTFSFKKMHLKMLSVKWHLFSLSINVLRDVTTWHTIRIVAAALAARQYTSLDEEVHDFKMYWFFIPDHPWVRRGGRWRERWLAAVCRRDMQVAGNTGTCQLQWTELPKWTDLKHTMGNRYPLYCNSLASRRHKWNHRYAISN